jgi:Uma2 family endonuclease
LAAWKPGGLVGNWEAIGFDVAPDWVCEFVSKETPAFVLEQKRRIYASFEEPHLWHLDPRSRVLEVFQCEGSSWLATNTFTGSEEISAPPFDAITFSLGLLWPFDPPDDQSKSGA